MSDLDLLVIGAGTLGARVAGLWQRSAPGARITVETASAARHEDLGAAGFVPRLRTAPDATPAPYVVFAVPPSQTADYAAEAARAARLFDGRGALVMTSSTAVYAEEAGGVVTEAAPLATSARAARLLAAEAAIRAAGGSAVRLAGLYERERGAHVVYAREATSPARPDGLVNLIHYDDAAALVVAALRAGERGATYLGADLQPVARGELARAFAAAAGTPVCAFSGRDGPLGRRVDAAATRRRLGFALRYPTFADWLRETFGG